MKIIYMLENSAESEVRLADAMLYHHLSMALGEGLESMDSFRTPPQGAILWGRDPLHMDRSRLSKQIEVYRNSAVLHAIGGEIVPRNAVDAVLSVLSARGSGAILRNMSGPVDRIRYTTQKDVFAQHDQAIGTPDEVLVQINRDLSHYRRFLVVGGDVAAETPVTFRMAGAFRLSGDELDFQCRDFNAKPSQAPGAWRETQRTAVDDFLTRYPLESGAIDVGLSFHGDQVTGHVESVAAAPPGGFDTYLADPQEYAKAVHVRLIACEPELAL